MGSTMLVDGPVLNFRWVMLDKFFSNFVTTNLYARGRKKKIKAQPKKKKKKKKKKKERKKKIKAKAKI